MFTEMNETEDDLNNGVTKSNYEKSLPKTQQGATQKVGTHVWLHRELYRSLRARNVDEDVIDIDIVLSDLAIISGVRVTADYKSELILPVRAEGIQKKAVQVINTLKLIY